MSSWLVLGAGAALVEARPASPTDPDAATPVLEVGAGNGSAPDVSDDGRFVVDQGPPADANDPRETTVWLSDLDLGTTVDLVALGDDMRPGRSIRPVIAGDGCSVVILTELALDFFRDEDSGSRWDAYRLVLPHCEGEPGDWELVSIEGASPVSARNDVIPADTPSVSRSGAVIAYTHAADHLAVGDLRAISVVDVAVPIDSPGRSVLAAGLPTNAPDTVFRHGGMDQPALSGSGRHLAFRSDAVSNEPVPRWGVGPTPGEAATAQVFAWDREQPDGFEAVKMLSATFAGEGSVSGAADPVVSRDGRVVAFVSSDTQLAGVTSDECGESCPTQVFRLDRDTDSDGAYDESGAVEMTLVSAEADGESPVPGTASSMDPALTADGDAVAFISKAPNLKQTSAGVGGDPSSGDLLRWDAATAALSRIVPAQDFTSRAGTFARPSINATGRTTVFDSGQYGDAPGRYVRAVMTPPQLSLADLDLGSTLVGETSDEWYVAVVNEGPSSFRPFRVAIDDDQFVVDEEESTCLTGVTVPPGGDCVLRVTFTPDSAGRASATLRVSELGYGGVGVEAELSGAGGQPSLRIEPAGGDLGTTAVGSYSEAVFFDVQNTSVVSTRIASIAISGANPGDFAIVSQNCLDRAFNPRAACTVGVAFTPTEPGRRTALVEVRSEDGAYATFLAGGDAEYAPNVVLSSPAVTAGEQMGVGGRGYPPNTPLFLRFADSSSPIGQTVSNEEGGFLTQLLVPLHERAGQRELVVESGSGVAGSVTLKVRPAPGVLVGMPGFGLG